MEDSLYLLSLLPFYYHNNNEKYLLTRILNGTQLPSKYQSLFCPRCVILFILTVNCKIKVCKRNIHLKCKMCDYELFFEEVLENKKIVEDVLIKRPIDDLFNR